MSTWARPIDWTIQIDPGRVSDQKRDRLLVWSTRRVLAPARYLYWPVQKLNSRPDYAREVKFALTDVRGVCERLGLIADRKSFVRQAGGLIIRCPWHTEKTPSCSIRIVNGAIAVKCHGCQIGGDILSLIAVVNGLNTR